MAIPKSVQVRGLAPSAVFLRTILKSCTAVAEGKIIAGIQPAISIKILGGDSILLVTCKNISDITKYFYQML
ncbi:MAG: hypothetical protein MRJ65_12770 [Candidatus Brocadiaceae bacterium]|nr:hypothetical protein [Candidatus Brocadiaceae bacterium]